MPANKFRAAFCSFKLFLVLLVTVAVWVPTIVTLVVSQVTSLSQQRNSAEREAGLALSNLHSLVFNNLKRAENFARLLSLEVQSGAITLQEADRDWLMDHLYDQIVALDATADAFLSSKDGRLIGRFIFSSGANGWWETDRNNTLRTWDVDPGTNRRTSLVSESHPFNTTFDGFYRVVVDNGMDCWSSVYEWQGSLFETFGVLTHAHNNPGEFWGVSGVDFRLGEVGKIFLNAQLPDGISVLVDSNTMQVLSTTDPDLKVIRDDVTMPKTINETGDPRIDHVLWVLSEEYGGSWPSLYKSLEGGAIVTRKHGDSFVSFMSLSRPCMRLVICIVVKPRLVSVEWKSLLTAGLVTLVVLALTVFLTFLIVRPLGKLSKEMLSISELKFKRSYSGLSGLSEFRQLDDCFGRLRQGIIAMTKYIPQQVVKDILSDGKDREHLAMESHRLAILFTDIKGFTTISESLPKKQVLSMLNEWIGAFTEVIHSNQGTVDKYIGDCIMAIWGAPLAVQKPEVLACRTALEFAPTLERLNRGWRDQGLPAIEVRVGVHYGETLVGNIGCSTRMNYTVCGNTANVAARLEQLGKSYLVSPIVSGHVYNKVKDEFVCEWLDTVVLRGHKVHVTPVYRLVAQATSATRADFEGAAKMQAIEQALVNRSTQSRALLDDALLDPALEALVPTIQMHIKNLEEGRELCDRVRDGVASAQSQESSGGTEPTDLDASNNF